MVAQPANALCKGGWTEPGLQTLWLRLFDSAGTLRIQPAFYADPRRRRIMHVVDDHVEVSETEASGGVKGQGVRYVLAISLLLAVILLSAIWIVPALLD